MTILIVEDDQDQLSVRSLLFRSNGFKTLEACDARAAAHLMKVQNPSCALVDLCLPTEQEGLQLIREMQEQYPALPIFVLTGKKTSPERHPELKAVAGVFVKGSSIQEIISLLRSWCHLSQAAAGSI